MRELKALDAGVYDVSCLVKGLVGQDGCFPRDDEVVAHHTGGDGMSHSLPLLSAVMLSASWTHDVNSNSAKRVFQSTRVEEFAAFSKTLSLEGDFAWYSSSCREMHPAGSTAMKSASIPRVLTIAGSDSGGGAGIQADMKACTNLGVFSASAVTAVTVQNTHGVHAIHAVPVNVIRDQIACVLDDIGADVVKVRSVCVVGFCQLRSYHIVRARRPGCFSTKRSSSLLPSRFKRRRLFSSSIQSWLRRVEIACSKTRPTTS